MHYDFAMPVPQPEASFSTAGRPATRNPDGRPRILTVFNSFNPGGVERVALRLNASWQRMGIAARVVTASADCKDDAAADVDFRVVPSRTWFDRRFRTLAMLRHLVTTVRAERPDVIFCPGNTYSFIVILLKIVLGADCPPIMAKVSNDLHRRDMGPVLRFFYHRWLWLQGRMIDRFVAIGAGMTDEIAQRMQVTPDRIAIINDPVLSAAELDRAVARAARPMGFSTATGRRYIAVGRMVPQKNFALLLDAFALVSRAEDRLTIIGDGVLRPALERQAVALGIADRVAMPGHVADVQSRMADADVFCMSSDYEGIPAVVIEAIAAGLPIVSTDCSAGMAALTGFGKFGTVVPVGDAAALAEAMASAPLGTGLSAAAVAHVRAFTLEAGAVAYLSLARSMIARRAPMGAAAA